jgi:phosphopantetheine adenylyltransferase
MPRYAAIILAICAIAIFCMFSDDDLKHRLTDALPDNLPAEPAKQETTQQFLDRMDRVKEYVMQKHFDELLEADKIKDQNGNQKTNHGK